MVISQFPEWAGNLEDIRPGDAGGMAQLGFWSPSGYEWVSESHSSHVWLFVTHGLYSPWNSLGQNTGVGSLSLLQGIFPTQDRTQVSRIAGRFFTSWATREAQEYWSG